MPRLKSPPLSRSQASDDSDRSAVKSLRKALGILDVVARADHPLTVAEVAMRCAIARPTAYRLVQTLLAEGYLIQDTLDARLSVGFAVLPLAASILDRNRMRIEALPHLHVLAQQTGERANLGMLYRDRVLYLAGVEKPALPTIYSRFGKSAPAHCCSLGKAILAYLDDAQVRAILGRQPLATYTANTIVSRPELMRELAETRARGYAVDRAEHVPGSYCVAVPIFDAAGRPVGAIGLSGHALDPLIRKRELLQATAELISHLL
jgi:DNA-binding IclR family transcriptional regulator